MVEEVRGPVRVRFAPSPTGYLHIGGARTALFNWLFARHYSGQFILRIEDTDRKRYKPDSLDDILSSLRWLGLHWDEGPDIGGPYGPYVQTQRKELYQKYAQQLLDAGEAYYCFCAPQRLAEVRKRQRGGQIVGYDRFCRGLDPAESMARVAAGESAVIRFKMPTEGTTRLHDLIRGNISWDNSKQPDYVLLKSDGLPTYHLANVIDDHLMQITHILRAEEWIPSAPLHIQLYRAFGWEPPAYAHLPVMLNPLGPDGKPILPGKLSKRKPIEDVSTDEDDEEQRPKTPDYTQVREFREVGYLAEALFNFLALQGAGYSASEEIFTREQLVDLFTIERVKPSPARLDYKKLDRINGIYIRSLPDEELARRLRPFLEQAGLEVNNDILLQVTPLVRNRMDQLDDVVPMAGFFFQPEIHVDPADLIGKDMTLEQSEQALVRSREVIATLPSFDAESLEMALRALAEAMGVKAGSLFGILRQALTGQRVAPPLFGTMVVLGRELAVTRVSAAEKLLKSVQQP